MTKPLLSGEDGPQKDETRATFAWVRDTILKLLHPFMPFIWPDTSVSAEWDTATKDVNWVIDLITALRSVRAEMNIPPSKKAPLLMISDTLDPRLAEYADTLGPMARVDGVEARLTKLIKSSAIKPSPTKHQKRS